MSLQNRGGTESQEKNHWSNGKQKKKKNTTYFGRLYLLSISPYNNQPYRLFQCSLSWHYLCEANLTTPAGTRPEVFQDAHY